MVIQVNITRALILSRIKDINDVSKIDTTDIIRHTIYSNTPLSTNKGARQNVVYMTIGTSPQNVDD